MLNTTDMLEKHDILMMDANTAVIGSLSEILETRKICKILSRGETLSLETDERRLPCNLQRFVFIGILKRKKKPFYTLG